MSASLAVAESGNCIMRTSRRNFISTGLAGGFAAALPGSKAQGAGSGARKPDYTRLDELLKQPVLKKELFTTPVIIESLELLRLNNNFLCRVRSKDGAVGISVANDEQMRSLYPVFVSRLQPF